MQSAEHGVAALKGTIELVTGLEIDDEITLWAQTIRTAPVINAGITVVAILFFLIFVIKSAS